MIYTLTTNPSLDYYINITGEIVTGDKNRSSIETFEAGGKGVNVSIFLDELGMGSTALGFLGGFTKSVYLDFINRYKNIQPLFTNISENTRINVTNLSDNTSFNAKGPSIKDEEFDKLAFRLNNLYTNDYLVLSGNIQEDTKDNVAKLINNLDLSDIKLILDTDSDVVDMMKLDNCLLVKINDFHNNLDDIKKKADELLGKNVKYVLYEDRLSKEVYLFSKKESLKYIEESKESNVHYADSFIAGLVYSFAKGASQKEAFNFACAACKLLTFSGFNKDIVQNIYKLADDIAKDILNV